MYNPEDLEKQDERMHHYIEEGKYLEALECAFESLKIAQHLFSPFHGRTGVCLNNIAYLLQVAGNYEEADNYYHQALNIIEKWGGPENPHLCPTLDSLAIMYSNIGRLKDAEQLFLQSLTIKRKIYDSIHPEVARSLNELGDLYRKQGRFSDAENNYKEAIATWEALGPTVDVNLEIVSPMLNLGENFRSRGNYPGAEAYISNGLELLLQIMPHDHYRTAPFFSSLGNLYYGKGEYSKSLVCHNKALDICTRNYGESHALTLQGMNNVAVTLKTLGEFEKAEVIYTKFMAIWGQIYTLDHLNLAPVYTDLAIIYEHLGDFEKAEEYHQKALKIRLEFLGSDHINVAVSLENLGNFELLVGKFEEAKSFYEEARAILERSDAPVSTLLVYNYNAAANIFKRLGQYKNAEKFYKKAVATCESLINTDPETFALALGNLGSFYYDNHNYEKAGEYIQRALQIRIDNIADDHPDNVWPLLHNVALRVIRENYPGITSAFKQIMSLQDRYIDMFFSFAKQEQKVTFIDNLNTVYSACLSFIHKFMSRDKETLFFGLETVFQRKGIVVDAESRTVEAILPLLPEEARKIWISRSDKFSQLSQLLLGNAPEVTANTPNRKTGIAKLQDEITGLENELKTSCDIAARALSRPIVAAAAVAGAMPKNTALLEFVKIRDFDFENFQDSWGLIRYIVFVLKSDGKIKLIDLGRAFDIDQTITEAIHSIREAQEGPEIILKQLYKLLWAPLEKSLRGIDKVIISPDGMLNLAPFAALIDKSGAPLVERFIITHVTSGREIMTPAENTPPGNDILVLAADADFDYREVIQLRPDLTRTKGGTFWFKPLPGTLQEAAEIQPLIPGDPGQIKILLKDKATKNAILNVENPRILHLATHGFSLPNPVDRFLPAATGLPRGLHSLTQMGLALAGANQADIEAGNDSGLLTIIEIAGMELQGTHLVVLSSCNPGIGEFMSGEGIFAFRRAFVLAGAKNLVMNLWPVNEKYTLLHMKEFYKNLADMSPAEALRQTQLQIIEDLKKDESYAGPLPWAPFIIRGGQALTDTIWPNKKK